MPCFNACCADLNLVLTPYDVLRLKNRLDLPSDRFLEEHAGIDEEKGRFPVVRLKMTDAPGRPCPFVTSRGCSVYEDRPGACRIYPLGRGSASGGRELYFLVTEDHCRGFSESRNWRISEWLADQGLEEYNRHNDRFMEILTAKSSLGPAETVGRKIQMFLMVGYNLDRFRAFVFGSRFLERFRLDTERVRRMEQDDEPLLELGYDWLRFALYGEPTLEPVTDRP